jgi:hypothetical protein
MSKTLVVVGLAMLVGVAVVGVKLTNRSAIVHASSPGGAMTMRVLSSYTARRIESQYLDSTASGVYVVVKIVATNRSGRPLTPSDDEVSFKANRSEYPPDTRPLAALELGGHPELSVVGLRPAATTSGWVAFDVPRYTRRAGSEVCVGPHGLGRVTECIATR